MMKCRTGVLTVLVLSLGGIPLAGQAPTESDPLAEVLFAPELIMKHRRAIGLTDEQRDAISRMIQELQGKVVRLEWELLDEMERLTETLGGERVDLDRALDRMNGVLEKEREVKLAHLELLVRIKNVLRPEQQAELRRRRDAERSGSPGQDG